MRTPYVVTSLAEDLRRIGLLKEEQDQEEPAPKPSEDGGYAVDPKDKAKNEAEDDDEDDDKEPQDEDMEKARSYIASLSKSFLKSHQPVVAGPVESKAPKAPKAPKAAAVESKKVSAKEARFERIRRLATGKLFESKTPKAAPATKEAPRSRINSLLHEAAEVSSILSSVERVKRQEQIKGFANVAVISEILSRRFQTIAMNFTEGGLYKVSGAMKRLSEQASDVAIALDSPAPEEEPTMPSSDEMPTEQDDLGDDAKVDMLFKKLMAKLLDALQLYNDVTGKDEDTDLDDTDPDALPPAAEGDEEEPEDDDMPLADADVLPSEDDAAASDDDSEDDDEEEPAAEQDDSGEDDDEEELATEQDDEEGDEDDKSVQEAKKALRRVLKQGLGKGPKKLKKGKKRKH